MAQKITFSRKDPAKFFQTLQKRVDNYFKEKNISKNANPEMVLKTVTMFALYIIPYVLLLTVSMPTWLLIITLVFMGLAMSGVGMSVMHDANHGSYSKHSIVNKLVGSSIYLISGNMFTWKVQHTLHHSYTNIHQHDEDLNASGLLRLSPYQKQRKAYKYQHLYSVFVYALLTLNWSLTKDFKQIILYLRNPKLPIAKANKKTVWLKLIAAKIVYFTIFLVIPTVVTDYSFGQIFLAYCIMHFTAGITLSVIFQLAHIVEGMNFPEPDDTGTMENTWAIHQLYTTADFSPGNGFVSWYLGGLNYQIEHHIFPNICHIHYRDIAKIVEATAKEFGLPYVQNRTIFDAIGSHFRSLKVLGSLEQKVLPAGVS